MRRLCVRAFAAATALSWMACGGASFVLDPRNEDAGTADAASDGATDGAPIEDAPRDAARRDAIAREATADVVEESPTHCGSGFACAPAVPAGWTGPFELYAGSASRPTCGDGFSGAVLDGNAGLTALSASCNCACGPSAGVQCSSANVPFYASATTCSLGTSCATATLTPGACTRADPSSTCGAALSEVMSLPQSTASGGSCAPVSTAMVPASSWATLARACGAAQAPTQADCAAGAVCAATPSSPFKASFCIEQSGNLPACPSTDSAAGYTSRFVYFAAVSDTRGCSACTCGSVTGASCSGTVTQFQSSDGTCNSGQIIYPLGQKCDPVQQPADLELTVAASGGSCAPGPVVSTGAATPSNAMTFCCTP